MTNTLTAWLEAQPEDHPGHMALRHARPLARLLAGDARPVPVSSEEPRLWLGVFLSGRAVRWRAGGLSGLQSPACGKAAASAAGRYDPALVWSHSDGDRVYSQGALLEAVFETARLGAAGRGFPGPLAFVQGAGSWLGGKPFAAGGFWWPDPVRPGRVTDGRRSVHYRPDLLGAFATVAEDQEASTWADSQGRVRSRRLWDGYWTGGDVVPAGFEDGWGVLSSLRSGVS